MKISLSLSSQAVLLALLLRLQPLFSCFFVSAVKMGRVAVETIVLCECSFFPIFFLSLSVVLARKQKKEERRREERERREGKTKKTTRDRHSEVHRETDGRVEEKVKTDQREE